MLPNSTLDLAPNAHRFLAARARDNQEEGNKVAIHLSCARVKNFFTVLHEIGTIDNVSIKLLPLTRNLRIWLQYGRSNVAKLVEASLLSWDEQQLHVVLGPSHKRLRQGQDAVFIGQGVQKRDAVI